MRFSWFWIVMIQVLCVGQLAHGAGIDRTLQQSKTLKAAGSYPEATDLLIKSLDSLKSNRGTDLELARILVTLTELSRTTLSFDIAVDYGHRALHKANEANSKELLCWIENRLSAIYFEKWNNDSARIYAERSIERFTSITHVDSNFAWVLPSSKILISAVYRNAGDFQGSKSILEEIMEDIESGTTAETEYPIVYFNLMLAYIGVDSNEAAIEVGVQGFEKAEAFKNYAMVRQFTERLIHLYEAKEDYKSTLFYQRKMTESIFFVHDFQKIADLKIKLAQYEYKEKQRNNQLLAADLQNKDAQNKLFGGLILLFLALGVSIFFLYRKSQKVNQRLNYQNELIEKQRKELMVLDEAKSRFFANVSHELKTPLSLILGPLDQIVRQENLPPSTKGNFDLAYGNVNRLQELVNEILDLTKLDTNKLVLKTRPLYFKKFIYRIFHSFKALAENKGLSMSFDAQLADELCLNLDKDKFEKVLSNLLSNAVKYSAEGSAITLKVSYADGVLTSIVTDQGFGMNEEDANRIFERFFQGTNKSKEGGLGIGLSLSKEYAKLMGGDIALKTTEGKGSQFIFHTKTDVVEGALDEASVEILEHTSLLEGISRHKNATILLVEDNHEMRAFIKSILAPMVKVLEAPNGNKALMVLEHKKVDLILSDVMMPELDGFELLAAVKANTSWKVTPFIMITAKSDLESKLTALQEGVDDYIQKPFVASELIARIQNVLDNVQLRKEETNLETESPLTEKADDQLIDKAKKTVLENAHLNDFNVLLLAQELSMSERTLYRALKLSTGLTPNNFIKEVKLKKARTLLEQESYRSVAEVAQAAGFKTRSSFTTQFVQRFGKKPSDYLQSV